MNKKVSKSPVEDSPPPGWLEDVLRAYRGATGVESLDDVTPVSESFLQRCSDASAAALEISKLRQERTRVGFVPLSFADYVQGLAKVTGVGLSPVLKTLGITDLSNPDRESAPGIGRLAKDVGLSLREILIQVRIGFAEQMGLAPIPVLVARRRSTGSRGGRLEECEAVLGKFESESDPKVIEEIRRIEAEIRAAYE